MALGYADFAVNFPTLQCRIWVQNLALLVADLYWTIWCSLQDVNFGALGLQNFEVIRSRLVDFNFGMADSALKLIESWDSDNLQLPVTVGYE